MTDLKNKSLLFKQAVCVSIMPRMLNWF